MTRIAEIHDATLEPSKQETVNAWLPDVTLTGAYRLVDTDGEVGIEGHLASDADGRLVQIPVSYRGESPGYEFATIEHSTLGTRYVSKALVDPVAVAEYVRLILSGDRHADCSDGKPTGLELLGSGHNDSVTVTDVRIEETTEERVRANGKINGVSRSFELRIPRLLRPVKGIVASRVPSARRIEGVIPGTEEKLLVAELIWRDL
ncbi:CG0192 family protein [Corynebacterium epidermidicanis]|uniref:Maltokinase N-terminal cap domain-containing protein n=1 Tax=Corynebacterium epidermidicanis TaxID=1050174 RepID=A0A0G3GR81_9CORY|nr:hypothetical protein [Corynebacterium epidermidicanis]AKK02083.1 hypothetical protein CEPID_00945 [Corynebacterium epidermidicanis]